MIMKFFSAVIIVFMSYALFAQDEGIVPMTQNTDIAGSNRVPLKINVGTFDSTFIYTTDTLSLPILIVIGVKGTSVAVPVEEL